MKQLETSLVCCFAAQHDGLENLYKKYGEQSLVVPGFASAADIEQAMGD